MVIPRTRAPVCCVRLPDFQMSDMPPQPGKLQPGVVKTQDPQIERDLHLSLDDLYLGCTKKIKISRRVGGELTHPRKQERETSSMKQIYLLFQQVLDADGYGSSIRDKILHINVKPGWKEGTKVIFPKEGDQVNFKEHQKHQQSSICDQINA